MYVHIYIYIYTYMCTYVYIHIYIYHFFIHSCVDRQVASISWLLEVMLLSILQIHVPFQISFFFIFFIYIYPGVERLDYMTFLFSDFWGTSIMFSIVDAPTYIHINSECFPHILFLISLLISFICQLFDDSHSDRCEVILYCGFDLHFSDK